MTISCKASFHRKNEVGINIKFRRQVGSFKTSQTRTKTGSWKTMFAFYHFCNQTGFKD